MLIPIERRSDRCRYYNGVYRCESYWSWIGRWIFLGITILFVVGMAYLLFSKKRKGTGASHANGMWGGGPVQQANYYPNNGAPGAGNANYGRTFVQQGPNDPLNDGYKVPPPAYTPSTQNTGSTPYPTDGSQTTHYMPSQLSQPVTSQPTQPVPSQPPYPTQ